MHLENQGLSLWYCTVDAPAPEGVVPADVDVPITVGMAPPDASNQVEVFYRIDGGPVEHLSAQSSGTDPGAAAQYFTARLPAFHQDEQVEWWVAASCAGRYVPPRDDARTAVRSFRAYGSSNGQRKERAMADAPSENAAPLVRVDPADGANAPTLSYNVPDPTSYPGRSYITLDFGDNDPFPTNAVVTPGGSVVVPGWAVRHSGRGAREVQLLAAREEGAPAGDAVLRPVRMLGGEEPIRGRELINSGVVRFDPDPMTTQFAGTTTGAEGGGEVVKATLTGEPGVQQRREENGRKESQPNGGKEPNGGGGGDPHDPPLPQAVVRLISPAEGATFDSGPNGFDLPVRIRVTFKNRKVHTTAGLPATAILTVNGTDVNAPWADDPVPDVREYAVSPKVLPGAVTLSAKIGFVDRVFSTMAARTIEVRAAKGSDKDATPPSIALVAPAEGLNLNLGASGAVTIEVRGQVVDPESGPPSCSVSLDGGDIVTVTVTSDGSFSHQFTVTSAGDHTILVRATNTVGLTSEVTRMFGVAHGALIPRHRLMLVECLRLSNYLGRYGAGRIVQTFSLLPGEKTSITIRSFESTTTTATETSSIFDSFSETTGDELTNSVTNEDTSKSQSEEDLKASVNVKAGASWGWGSASVEAGLAYGTSSAREQLTKNVTNGASRHAAEKSSKRDVKVDTTRTVTSQTENETTIVRTLENTNLSRTLNFVFRQMTQEFVSLLHLADMRIAHLTEWFQPDGKRVQDRVDYEEVALPQLHSLLQRICASAERATTAEAIILRQLDAVFDYLGNRQAIVQEVSRDVPSRDPLTGQIRTEVDPNDPSKTRPVNEKVTWTRFDPDLRGTWPPQDPDDPAPPFTITVPGVILGVTQNTLRTDGIVVDAFLGGGPALDAYSSELQRTAIAAREAEAEQAQAEVARTKLGVDIVSAGEANKAELYAKVFAPPPKPPLEEVRLDGQR
jgi:hypothetical protein